MTIRLPAEDCGRPWTTPAAKHFKYWRNLRLTKKNYTMRPMYTQRSAQSYTSLYIKDEMRERAAQRTGFAKQQ